MCHAGFGARVAQILVALGQCLRFGGSDDHVQAHKHLDVVRVTPSSHSAGAYFVDLDFGRGLGLPTDKHAFSMPPGKHQSTVRAACLKQHRRSLWRGFAQVIALHLIELTLVFDLVYLVGLGVDALHRVVEHRAIFPAAFPEFVEHLQVFIGLIVAPVVFDLLGQAHRFGGAVEVTGHNIPAHAPTA